MTPFEATRWPLKQLRSLCQPIETVDPRRTPTRSFKYIDIASVSNLTFQITTPKDLIGSAAPSRARKRIRTGDVIFATTRPYLRSVALVTREYDDQVCSTGFCVLRAGDSVLPEWLFHCVLSEDCLAQITPKMRGANYPAVTDKDIQEACIPVPPIHEQGRIVARIQEMSSRVDEIKRLRDEAHRETRALIVSIVDALLDPNWPRRSIGELASEIRNGWSGKASHGGRALRILRLSCVHGLHINVNESKAIVLDEEVSAPFQIYKDDVFLVRGNGSKHLVGRSAIALEDNPYVIFNDLLIRIRFRARILPAFANIALHSTPARRQIERSAKTAAGIWKINQGGLSSIELPCPPLGEQERVLGEFNLARSLCTEIQRALEPGPVDSLSGAILRKAFAGEL